MADDVKKNDAEEDKEEKQDKSAETPPPPHHEEISTQTTHTVSIAGVDVEYTATAGRILLAEEEGKKKASFFFVSYTRNDVEDLDETTYCLRIQRRSRVLVGLAAPWCARPETGSDG